MGSIFVPTLLIPRAARGLYPTSPTARRKPAKVPGSRVYDAIRHIKLSSAGLELVDLGLRCCLDPPTRWGREQAEGLLKILRASVGVATCRNPLYKHATEAYLADPHHCPYDSHGRGLLQSAAEVPVPCALPKCRIRL